MKILDIVSWLPAKGVSLEELESVFENYRNAFEINEYAVLKDLPEDTAEPIVECRDGLINEGKKVLALAKENKVVALVGYQ